MNGKEKKVLLIAHRGANRVAPENTLKAFSKAIEFGADYIEFDIHRSKDGEIVVMHDADTFRTTGSPFPCIWRFPWATICYPPRP